MQVESGLNTHMSKYPLVESTQALYEHVVANPKSVDTYLAQFAAQVRSPEAKAWLTKKLRALVMNDEQYLDHLPNDSIESRFAELHEPIPAYVSAAANVGEPVYLFLGFEGEMWTRVQEIVHFFQSLEEAANSEPDPANALEIERKRLAPSPSPSFRR